MRGIRGITLIALVITIIVLLILAGVTLKLTLGDKGILKVSKDANKNYIEAEQKEIEDLDKLYSQIQIAIDDNAQITISTEDLKKYISSEVDKKLEMQNNLYQKLRSDSYIDVGQVKKFIAPTDGYFTIGTTLIGTDVACQAYVKHYLENGTLIEQNNISGSGNSYENGITMYMKKGEYIEFVKEGNVKFQFCKFWYAEGCVSEGET